MRSDTVMRVISAAMKMDLRPLAMILAGVGGLVALEKVSPMSRAGFAAQRTQTWLAGDHHVHSEWSVGWNDSTNPPTPIRAGDARYPIVLNAENARRYGLSWMVSTDHGGPNHSKVNRDLAYPQVLAARKSVPELLLFYGMEFDTPAADHSSLVIPFFPREKDMLYDIESRFAKRDKFPRDTTWDTEPRMVEALTYMKGLERAPVLIANHPARSATGLGAYGQDTPSEFRAWNDAAPRVAIGMEGAPGHQAGTINRDGSRDTTGSRGGYSRLATIGGFDQMTARLGGLWDSMLGEGRRWWITSTSDSHSNWRDGGSDFWPGEYSKTYVFAARTHDDVLDGLRGGRVFVTTGDLISELHVTAEQVGQANVRAAIGGTLTIARGADVRVTIRIRDPRGENSHGDTPTVSRVDLITGDVNGRVADRTTDVNATTRVAARFTSAEWRRNGEFSRDVAHGARRTAAVLPSCARHRDQRARAATGSPR